MPRWIAAALTGLLAMMSGCQTTPPLRIDTSTPGWSQRTGQFVWTPGRDAPEVVVDLQVWNRSGGECVLEVSKAGLPLALAHVTNDRWEIESAAGQRHAASGLPPVRVGWLQLARALAGQTPTPPWRVDDAEPRQWRLTNTRSGERLEGLLTP